MSGGTYNPTRTYMVWGVLPISGYPEGSMIEVTREGDGVRGTVGTAGETAFIETPNRMSKVKFRVLETATAVNSALSALFDLGNVPLPLLISSLSTGAAESSTAAKLERKPGVTYDNNVPVREWTFICLKMETTMLPVSL